MPALIGVMEDISIEGATQKRRGSDWSVTKAENGLGLGDDIDPEVELKRKKNILL